MKLVICSLQEFYYLLQGRKMVCFGASQMPIEMCEEYNEYHFEKQIRFFVDNDPNRQGDLFYLKGQHIPIVSVDELCSRITNADILLITSRYYVEIFQQLDAMSEFEETQCYIWPVIAPQYKTDEYLSKKIKTYRNREKIIPKKIHYCWFGNEDMPELDKWCVATWEKICPDYEIIRWDESNYDIGKNEYMRQAYDAKKWGFVPDYARLDIIYNHGGIYLDTDVEVIRNFDELCDLDAFAGFESKSLINLGLGFGAKKNHPLIKVLLDSYDSRIFRYKDGTMDLTASPYLQTETLLEYGLLLNNQFQMIHGMAILPTECLSPDNNMIPHITENTYSIHHFAGSWTSEKSKVQLGKMREFSQMVRKARG